jgi:mono/diheme cytochrome c family protein
MRVSSLSFRSSSNGLDQPAINRHRLIAEKLIAFKKLEQLSASNWTRVALGGGARRRVLAAHSRGQAGGACLAAFVLAALLPAAPLMAQADAPKPEAPAAAALVPAPEASASDIDGETMFATSCGFCHEQGGRHEGKGPKLSNSKRSDAYIIDRIKKGKVGAMPAFGRVFSDGQVMAILAYIRGLDE